MAAVQSWWSYQAHDDVPVLHSAASPKFVMPEPKPALVVEYVLMAASVLAVCAGLTSAGHVPRADSLAAIGAGFVLFVAGLFERPSRLRLLSRFRPEVSLDCPLAGHGCAADCISQRRATRASQPPPATRPRGSRVRRRSHPIVS